MRRYKYNMNEWVICYRNSGYPETPIFGQIKGHNGSGTWAVKIHKPYPTYKDNLDLPYDTVIVQSREIIKLTDIIDPTDEELLIIMSLPLGEDDVSDDNANP
jgi:hypothetical protein